MTVTACPACSSPRVHLLPPSHRTGRHNFECRACGLAGWRDRDRLVVPEMMSVEEVSAEERAAWFAAKRDDTLQDAWAAALDRITTMLGGASGKSLYDIGAGDGHFLSVARERGYDVRGNDLFEAAVQIAKEQYDVAIDVGDISGLTLPPQDALTLWCVIAHVEDPAALLRNCHDALRPGGVLFLQTPHRCAVDTAALRLLDATGGRVSRWVDRRIAEHHWILHTATSLKAALEAAGFTDVQTVPKARYSLAADPYLRSLGAPPGLARTAGKAADKAIDRGLAPRIVIDAYARRP